MASEVDICNLALSHIGDDANVSSISPPEGSVQSEYCSRFYPIARDSLLQMHPWNFASKRMQLALVTQPFAQWKYAYAVPDDMMTAVSVLPPEAENDYASRFTPSEYPYWNANYVPLVAAGAYVPQPYSIEIDALGNKVIYTDQENALLRYQAKITDPTRFDPLFTMALSYHLASMLAGPVIKSEQGAAEAKRCQQMMAVYLAQAKVADGNQRNIKVEHIVPWTSGR